MNDLELGGSTVPGTKGYRYFGRAKYLEGVKELFEKAGTIFNNDIDKNSNRAGKSKAA